MENKLPIPNETILAYKHKDMGGYYKRIYIVTYKEWENRWFFIIQDACQNKNNYRLLYEFSHWMPLPDKPKVSPMEL